MKVKNSNHIFSSYLTAKKIIIRAKNPKWHAEISEMNNFDTVRTKTKQRFFFQNTAVRIELVTKHPIDDIQNRLQN